MSNNNPVETNAIDSAPVAYVDVTGTTITMNKQKVAELISSLPAEHKRFAVIPASAVKEPQEIWEAWNDNSEQAPWIKYRTYLQFLDLSPTDIGQPYCVAIAQFEYAQQWELRNLEMRIGNQEVVAKAVNQQYRTGNVVYSGPGSLHK